ncbi:MAG: YhcH/YjgK/YiaL family protein [Clostridia bacterium]|nr:YhcH/YjgK/YiaL family protein [Clostridia bacterium]
MIIDRIEEQKRYYPLHKEMEQAFAFISEALDLEPGRYDLDNGLYATISEGMTRPKETINFEAHRKYIDLQYVITGGERIAWANINELNRVGEEPERDNYYFEGPSTSFTVRPGSFYIMFPGDAHKTSCHKEFPKYYKKVVIKLPLL